MFRCMNNQPNEVALCTSPDCALYVYRMGRGRGSTIKAIKRKCLDCATLQDKVKSCKLKECFLYTYRLGKNPKRKGLGGSLEQLKTARSRIQKTC